jgi:hypothetical protein
MKVLLAYNIFQRSIFLTKYICITAYQICSCSTSSGRAIFACYRKLGKFSNVTRRSSETNVINKERTKF